MFCFEFSALQPLNPQEIMKNAASFCRNADFHQGIVMQKLLQSQANMKPNQVRFLASIYRLNTNFGDKIASEGLLVGGIYPFDKHDLQI